VRLNATFSRLGLGGLGLSRSDWFPLMRSNSVVVYVAKSVGHWNGLYTGAACVEARELSLSLNESVLVRPEMCSEVGLLE